MIGSNYTKLDIDKKLTYHPLSKFSDTLDIKMKFPESRASFEKFSLHFDYEIFREMRKKFPEEMRLHIFLTCPEKASLFRDACKSVLIAAPTALTPFQSGLFRIVA